MLDLKTSTLLLCSVFASMNTFEAIAVTPNEEGLTIAISAKAKDTGWKDFTADMTMLLRNEQGQESLREIKIKTLELQGDGDKSLTLFNKPRDVKGTNFLSFSHPIADDDQWLYLPALKRVKRISSSNKSGPFMGSEFSFEDLSSFEVEKYTYLYLGDEVINNENSYVVEQYPVDENSGYTRRISWIDKSEYRTHKIDFYDRKNALLKTLTFTDFRQYLNNYWRADNMVMLNHQNGKSTKLQWSNYDFSTGLSENDFNKNALKRAR